MLTLLYIIDRFMIICLHSEGHWKGDINTIILTKDRHDQCFSKDCTILMSLNHNYNCFRKNTLQFNSLSYPCSLPVHSMMMMTTAQTEDSIEGATQMVIPNATLVQLHHEGISSVDDLVDFDKDSLGKTAKNLRRPGGGFKPFVFGYQSYKLLLVACDLVHYNDTVSRPLTAGNMNWNPIMQNFGYQWISLNDNKDGDAH